MKNLAHIFRKTAKTLPPTVYRPSKYNRCNQIRPPGSFLPTHNPSRYISVLPPSMRQNFHLPSLPLLLQIFLPRCPLPVLQGCKSYGHWFSPPHVSLFQAAATGFGISGSGQKQEPFPAPSQHIFQIVSDYHDRFPLSFKLRYFCKIHFFAFFIGTSI